MNRVSRRLAPKRSRTVDPGTPPWGSEPCCRVEYRGGGRTLVLADDVPCGPSWSGLTPFMSHAYITGRVRRGEPGEFVLIDHDGGVVVRRRV